MNGDQLNRINICDVLIDNLTQDEVLSRVEDLIREKGTHFIVTPNVDHIIKIQKDPEFSNIYKEADLVLPDGMPIIWASKYLGAPLKERITGSDLFPEICRVSAEKGYRIFLLGGRPGAAVEAKRVLEEKYKDLDIVGTYSPPYGFEYNVEENNKINILIKETAPDILFVGLGAPKQEKWIYKNKDIYKTPLSVGVGVSFELTSGIVKRAPKFIQKLGMEWFWRFIMEPKRLWKRYFIDDMKIFLLVWKQKRRNN